jgi:hypothetical protein
MLLIAQPKTASSSLLHGLAKITGLKAEQDFKLVKKGKRSPQYDIGIKDMADVPEKIFEKWLSRRKWQKQHLIPTLHNMWLIKKYMGQGHQFIALLRDPQEATEAFYRVPGRPDKAEEKRQRYDEYLDTLIRFNYGWRMVVRESLRLIIVEFEDLVGDQPGTMNKILEHYGRKERVTGRYKLPKRRYTGKGTAPYRFK